MSISETISPFVGRMALAWFFLSEAWARVADWNGSITMLRNAQIPGAELFLVLALAIMMLGGAGLALGYHARHGAMLLFGVRGVGWREIEIKRTPYGQPTVTLHGRAEQRARALGLREPLSVSISHIRDLAVAGGLLLVVGLGPGPFAIDNLGKKRRAFSHA